MIISDLNHIEVVNEETNIVGGFRRGRRFVSFFDKKNINIRKRVDVKEFFVSAVNAKGNAAVAEATADVFGADTNAETITDIKVTPFRSQATSLSVGFTN
ncbi:MAG: hypothetical protein F6K26_48120 [Moorea sp. SIO2I5]|nr:hypothetical protein [Moorena sp. SIO2I5]